MRLEKKLAIIGGLWGLLSLIPFMLGAWQGANVCNINILLKWKLLALPTYISSMINCKISLSTEVSAIIGIPYVLGLPIIIGVLNGYLFAKIYKKLKK